ncbi:MAG TPA: glycosyl hydrolase [Micromonosporaceae bacterium]|nr:glycosyl hydrolase [Micromonosporaceae bacterium]
MIPAIAKKLLHSLSALAVLISGGAVAVLLGASPAAAACVVDEKLVNSCRPWLGAAANGYPGVSGDAAEIRAHEQRIGRPLDIVHLYTPPGQMQLTSDSVALATRPDTILSVTWQPATRWADANGANAAVNADIDRMADSINALGDTRIMLTVHHEPEDDLSGGGVGCGSNKQYVGRAGTPAEYRTLWRTVRQRFDAKGVDNVVWVMNYMGYTGWDCVVDDLYPGNDLVDWIKWDPYGTQVDWPTLIGRFYDYLTNNSTAGHDYLSKVWGIAEWGSWHRATQEHAYLLNRTAKVAVEANRFPRLKAISVFDVSGTCRIAYDRDGNYDAQELALYREYANSPAFRDPVDPAPDTEPPGGVTGLAATAATGRVTLGWSAASDNVAVTGYAVYRDGVFLATTTGLSYADTAVTAGATYSYRVAARDAAGNEGPRSAAATATVPAAPPGPDSTPPSTPTGFTATAGVRQIRLAWNASTDNVGVAGYYLVRDGRRIATLSAGTLTYTDTGLTSGRRYYYEVRAFDAAGNRSPTTAADAVAG